MSQATANPEEIERFARNLKQFDNDLMQRMSLLKSQVAQLGSTWRDQEYTRFSQDFQRTLTHLDHFLRESENHILTLNNKAKKLREYLNQR